MSAKKSQADPKRCSLAEAERWLGVSRQTLAKWIDRGAPVEERPETKGKPTLVSVADLHKWAVDRATEEAEERIKEQIGNLGIEADIDPSRMPKDEADRRKAVAEALRSELRLAGDAGNLVPVADVGPAVARHLVPVRERLMSLHMRTSEIPDSDYANSRTAVSVIPGQLGHG